MELTTNGVLITDSIKFVQARPKAIGDRLVASLYLSYFPRAYIQSIILKNSPTQVLRQRV